MAVFSSILVVAKRHDSFSGPARIWNATHPSSAVDRRQEEAREDSDKKARMPRGFRSINIFIRGIVNYKYKLILSDIAGERNRRLVTGQNYINYSLSKSMC